MKFSIRLKELREERGLTQAALANYLGVGVSTVGMWESTKRTPSSKTLNKLVELFGCTIDYLLGYSDIRYFENNANSANNLTEDELQLVSDYRRLSPGLKDMIKRTMDVYLKRETSAYKVTTGD